MKILLVNKFLYPKGGDAITTLSTGDLLAKKGHEVFYWGMEHPENPIYSHEECFVPFVDYNSRGNVKSAIKAAMNIIYSFEASERIERMLNRVNPDIVHLNNFAHQISPSILPVIKRRNIPVIMTMHDYKLVCPVYTMHSKGEVCEQCQSRRYYRCVLRKCTMNSRLKSLINTLEMYLHHSIFHIYDKVDYFISPSIFLMNKMKEMGFHRQILYLPNFVDIDLFRPSSESRVKSIVYVGRLSYEKGIKTLIDAMRGININLKIIGDGPLKQELINKISSEKIDNIDLLGYKDLQEIKHVVGNAMFAVTPSEWYENNPRSILEAFALGKPVIGSDIGGIPELVKNGSTGYTFTAGDSSDLQKKILSLAQESNSRMMMGQKARSIVEEKFNPERYYSGLMKIYLNALKKKSIE